MVSRRRFNQAAAAAAAGMAAPSLGAAAPVQPQAALLKENGFVPNNPMLPVLRYWAVLDCSGDAAAKCEARFQRNGWPPQWRNGVYTFHHYHSTAHEILGFTRGHARLVLGGGGGREFDIRAGDVLVLPTGTGHCEPVLLGGLPGNWRVPARATLGHLPRGTGCRGAAPYGSAGVSGKRPGLWTGRSADQTVAEMSARAWMPLLCRVLLLKR